MMDDSVERVVLEVIAAEIGVPVTDLSLDTRFDEIEMDSMEVVEITMALEDRFQIAINDEAVEKLDTIGDLVRLIGGEGESGTPARLKPRPSSDSGHAA